MTLNDQMLQKLVTPKPGAHMVTSLPKKSTEVNAALIRRLGLSVPPAKVGEKG